MDKFLKIISDFISHQGLPVPPAHLLIALSGGADSVFLLRAMKALGYRCTALHCNFHLRGDESNRDEQFVRDLCNLLNVPLQCVSFDTLTYASEHHIGIEQAARDLRYTFFHDQLISIGADAVAVAHHRDDNVETMLWNLVRGTGLRGMRGMMPRNGEIIRPLLSLSREDILEGLRACNQDFVTDSTNLTDEVTRNKIRHNIIPLLQQLNPAAVPNIDRMMENMREVWKIYYDHIAMMTCRCVSQHEDATVINLSKLNGCPSPSTVLHEILSPMGFNHYQTDNMLKAQSGKMFTSSSSLPNSTIYEVRVKADKHGRRLIVRPLITST